jgi:two-component system LytT family response regulator
MIKTIIVEDEEQKRLSLRNMLNELRPDVEIVAEAVDINSAKELIKEHNPELVLLDIRLPDGTSFDLLEQLTTINFKIIFITAYDEYAVKAFKFSAVDYILKPVSAQELVDAIDKVVAILWAEYNMKINTLLQNHQSTNQNEKRIILKTLDKIYVIRVNDIVRCQSDASYCHFLLSNGSKITVSKPLKEYTGMFSDYGFFRVHKSHLVNMRLVKRFDRSEGGYVIMENDDKIPVSSHKREELFEFLEML